MRPVLVVGLLLALAFSGCADKGDPLAGAADADEAPPLGSVLQDNTTTTAPNRAPTGSLVTAQVDPESPSNVTFTLEGSDADGDSVSWALAFGDGNQSEGTELPGNLTHEYAAGAFNATLTLDDGKETTQYHATIHVSAEARVAEVIQFSGHVIGPDPTEGTEGECLFALLDSTGLPGVGGIAGDHFVLGGNRDGWVFAFNVAGMVAQFQDAAGYVGDKAESGMVPDGATSVLACSHLAVNTDYTLALTSPV